jgi:iron complex transport system permease protein
VKTAAGTATKTGPNPPKKPELKSPVLWMVVFVIALGVAMVVSLSVGAVHLPFGTVLASLWERSTGLGSSSGLTGTDAAVLFDIRLPRVVLGLLVGSSLSLAGASYQGVFRNPLADPYLLGAAAGAGLGATLVLSNVVDLTGWQVQALPLAAFVGAMVAVVLSVGMASVVGAEASDGSVTSASAVLLLAGVAIASFLTAIQTFVQQQRAETLRVVYAWILGGLTTSGWSEVRLIAPYLGIASIVLLALARKLDVMAVGDDEARSLGVSPTRVRIAVVIAASLATAAAVSVSGLIGFVGLVIPHAVRSLVGHGHRFVLTGSILLGGAFVVLADSVARTIVAPAELPLGVLTAFIGAPAFALLLVRQHRSRS